MRSASFRVEVLIAMMLLVFAGCTHHRARHYANAEFITEDDSRRPILLPGATDVFVYDYSRMYLPLPDAFSGWSFFLSLNPALVHASSTVALPHGSTKTAVLRLRAPSVQMAGDAEGTIVITSATPTEVVAIVDLACPFLDWRYRGTVRFTTELSPNPSPQRPLPTDGLTSRCSGPALPAAER